MQVVVHEIVCRECSAKVIVESTEDHRTKHCDACAAKLAVEAKKKATKVKKATKAKHEERAIQAMIESLPKGVFKCTPFEGLTLA